jgi:hypothetical protein
MSKIVFIENLNSSSSGKYDNLPNETEYIIISRLNDYIEETVLGNVPVGLKKIIIIDYEKTITYYSGYKSLQEYIDFVTGGKIPFGCDVETMQDEKMGYEEDVCFFNAIADKEDDGQRLFKLNKRIEKGVYDIIYFNNKHKEIEMNNFIHIDGKNIYINVDLICL